MWVRTSSSSLHDSDFIVVVVSVSSLGCFCSRGDVRRVCARSVGWQVGRPHAHFIVLDFRSQDRVVNVVWWWLLVCMGWCERGGRELTNMWVLLFLHNLIVFEMSSLLGYKYCCIYLYLVMDSCNSDTNRVEFVLLS